MPSPDRPGQIRSIVHRLSGDRRELPVEGRLASLEGATGWLNSDPLTAEDLRGRVVLVDFWTYTCVNWLRTLPYLRAWADKYEDDGLTVGRLREPLLAGGVHRRRGSPNPIPSLRRGRVPHDRNGQPTVAAMAEDDAAFAVDFALGAVEEAEYASFYAVLARANVEKMTAGSRS
jgi:thiol-disulfide isomerase/thioredoxin